MVTEELSQSWLDDGFALVRNVFPEDMMDLLRAGTESAMANPGQTSKEYAEEGKGRFFTDHHMRRRFPEFQKFLDESLVRQTGAQLIRS